MFIILSYDVNVKRVSKINKICKKYLYPVHRSVFEGTLTEKQMNALKREIEQNIDCQQDSVYIYELDSSKYAYKVKVGRTVEYSNML